MNLQTKAHPVTFYVSFGVSSRVRISALRLALLAAGKRCLFMLLRLNYPAGNLNRMDTGFFCRFPIVLPRGTEMILIRFTARLAMELQKVWVKLPKWHFRLERLNWSWESPFRCQVRNQRKTSFCSNNFFLVKANKNKTLECGRTGKPVSFSCVQRNVQNSKISCKSHWCWLKWLDLETIWPFGDLCFEHVIHMFVHFEKQRNLFASLRFFLCQSEMKNSSCNCGLGRIGWSWFVEVALSPKERWMKCFFFLNSFG